MKCKDCGQEFEKLYAPSKQQCQRCYKREWERNANKDPVKHAKIRARAKRVHINNRAKHLDDMKAFREKANHDSKRQKLLKANDYRCSECGEQFDEKDLIRHHKDRNVRGKDHPNNSEDNEALLCRSCHCKEHQAELIQARRTKRVKIESRPTSEMKC